MKKVLIVDDTKNIRMILTKCLELEGYEVLTASDGTQALELFMTHTFDLAFLDIKLPGVRGTEVLKRIREKGIKTPVIIITAYATVKNAVDCTNLGAVAYVQKPFSADKIRNVLLDFENSSLSSKNEENSDSFILRAKSYLDADEFEKSLDFAQKALAKDVENPELYLLISRAYRGMGNEKSAERFYQFYKTFISE